MNTRQHLEVCIAAVAVFFISAERAVGEEPPSHEATASKERTVKLTIKVHGPDNEPVAGVPLCVTSRGQQIGAVTDVLGQALLRMSLDSTESRVVVRPGRDCPSDDGSAIRWKEITSTYVVRWEYPVEVPNDVRELQSDIKLEKSLLVKGRLLDEAGKPAKATGFVRGVRSLSTWRSDGCFSLPVPQGERVELAFVGNPRIALIPVGPLDATADLGDVQVAPVMGDAVVRIKLTDGDKADPGVEDMGSSVALISADAKTILGYIVKPDGLVVANYGTSELPKIPAGIYHITPGLFGNSLSLRVLDAIRAGATTDLDKAGVPRIDAVAGKEVELTISIPQAAAAISTIPARAASLPKPDNPPAPK